jgi:antitoxin (DNA-binding transcriptional repressor) of toxin-antitoxin stability system
MTTASDHSAGEPVFVLVGGRPSLDLVANRARRHNAD